MPLYYNGLWWEGSGRPRCTGYAPQSHLLTMTQRMGTYAEEPRKHKIQVRLTDIEMAEMKNRMHDMDYLSVSKYIRDTVFRRRQTVRRVVDISDSGLGSQIEKLIAQVRKIGVNYNQVVTRYGRTLCMTRKDGSPAVSDKATIFYLEKLAAYTQRLASALDGVKKEIEKCNNLNKNNITDMQTAEIIGNVVADCETKAGRNGEYVTFTVAVNEIRGEERTTTYYDVRYVKNGLRDFIRKGTKVFVRGNLSISTNIRDGKTFVNVNIGAREIELLSSPAKGE